MTKYYCISEKELKSLIRCVKSDKQESDEYFLSAAKIASVGVISEHQYKSIKNPNPKHAKPQTICPKCNKHVYSQNEHCTREADLTFSSEWECPDVQGATAYSSTCPQCKLSVYKKYQHLIAEGDRSFSSEYDCPSFNTAAKTSICDNCKKPAYSETYHHSGRNVEWKCYERR